MRCASFCDEISVSSMNRHHDVNSGFGSEVLMRWPELESHETARPAKSRYSYHRRAVCVLVPRAPYGNHPAPRARVEHQNGSGVGNCVGLSGNSPVWERLVPLSAVLFVPFYEVIRSGLVKPAENPLTVCQQQTPQTVVRT